MVYQFHHQFKDRTEIKAQSADLDDAESVQVWIREQVASFPPPDGAINMLCNENSEFFVRRLKEKADG